MYIYIYIYNCYIATNNDDSINDHNKNNDCFYCNSFNVNDERNKIAVKIKIEIAIISFYLNFSKF